MYSRVNSFVVAALIVAGSAVLAACGADRANDGGSAGHTGASAPTSMAAADHNDADIAFATHMIPHHQQAVVMAGLAAERAFTPEIKALAERIQAAQQPEIDQLTAWLQEWGAPPPSGGQAGHGAMPGMMTEEQMNQLRQAMGGEFERHFVTMMVEHHRGAIEMAQVELRDGKNAEAKALAQRIADDQQAEITEMQRFLPQG